MNGLVLFGTSACHLCEEAADLLQTASAGSVAWSTVDIADDPVLLERYGTRIPVLRDALRDLELDWPFSSAEIDLFVRGQAR